MPYENKSPEMQKFLNAMFPEVSQGKCPMCKTSINMKDFKDGLSLKEYRISGHVSKMPG